MQNGARLCEPQARAQSSSIKLPAQFAKGEAAAGRRLALPNHCTLADLYDPVAMPPALAKAHAELDRAVDRCYSKEPFPSDRARVEYLFALYEKLTAPLLPATKAKRSKIPDGLSKIRK